MFQRTKLILGREFPEQTVFAKGYLCVMDCMSSFRCDKYLAWILRERRSPTGGQVSDGSNKDGLLQFQRRSVRNLLHTTVSYYRNIFAVFNKGDFGYG